MKFGEARLDFVGLRSRDLAIGYHRVEDDGAALSGAFEIIDRVPLARCPQPAMIRLCLIERQLPPD